MLTVNEEAGKINCQLGGNSLCQAACASPRRVEVSWGPPESLKGARAPCARCYGPAPVGMENILVLFLVTMFNVLEVKIEKSDAKKGHDMSRSIT